MTHRFFHAFLWRRLSTRLRSISLLVLDVDGVLTDGGLWIDPNGLLQKRFDVRDGLGIRLLQQAGLQIVFMSGGHGGATEVRAHQLGIHSCLVSVKDKYVALEKLQSDLSVSPSHTAFVGDDLNDLVSRNLVDLFITPADACSAVRRNADIVLSRRGGDGAVRELAEYILKARGLWNVLSHGGWKDFND